MLHIHLPKQGFAPTRAAGAVESSGLVDLYQQHATGPFGVTSTALLSLEALTQSVDIGLAAHEGLKGLVMEALQEGATPYQLPTLQAEHRQFLASFMIVVITDALTRKLGAYMTLPGSDEELDLDGLPELLGKQRDALALVSHLLKLGAAYVKIAYTPSTETRADVEIGAAFSAFLSMARKTVLTFSQQSAFRPLLSALKKEDVMVAGYPYDGLLIRQTTQDASGLLPMGPDDIVGNEDYLQAGLRLARDVAGYDMEQGFNPKRVNPILFGLGRPGCGKTVTAHAVGNYFLNYCKSRNIPAKFLVIQRTDWASSYQNASASNLVRIFREEVYGFDGVCGVYWPDIDTAFASRDSGQLRSEEKQNLGAVFGVFDGTLLPKDGKWFLLCDANTMHMDEATVSRIAQNPMTVEGPTQAKHYAILMRDLLLRDVQGFIPADDASWQVIGQKCVELNLSGRNVDAICGNIRTRIQDFEFPESYFHATTEERTRIIEQLCHPVSSDDILGFIDDWAQFKQDAERRGEEQRFEREVESIVRRLNASDVAQRLRFGD